MAFEPLEFLTVADGIAGPDEASNRTAVGRMYYGVFLSFRDRLGQQTNRQPSVHRLVSEALAQRLETVGARQALDQLRRLRNIADYDTAASISRANVAEARRLVASLRLLLESLPQQS